MVLNTRPLAVLKNGSRDADGAQHEGATLKFELCRTSEFLTLTPRRGLGSVMKGSNPAFLKLF